MRLPSSLLFVLSLCASACNLPIEDKAACEDTRDCIDARACVDGECTDGACQRTCDALCEARRTCGVGPACLLPCFEGVDEHIVLVGGQCGTQYDLLQTDECDAITCYDACLGACSQGASCALVEDIGACTVQCQLEATCDPPRGTCNELDAGALTCWSRGRPSGC